MRYIKGVNPAFLTYDQDDHLQVFFECEGINSVFGNVPIVPGQVSELIENCQLFITNPHSTYPSSRPKMVVNGSMVDGIWQYSSPDEVPNHSIWFTTYQPMSRIPRNYCGRDPDSSTGGQPYGSVLDLRGAEWHSMANEREVLLKICNRFHNFRTSYVIIWPRLRIQPEIWASMDANANDCLGVVLRFQVPEIVAFLVFSTHECIVRMERAILDIQKALIDHERLRHLFPESVSLMIKDLSQRIGIVSSQWINPSGIQQIKAWDSAREIRQIERLGKNLPRQLQR